MLTVQEVRECVDNIAKKTYDDEVAHSMEDGLHQEVLRAIANGACENPQACAAEALKTCDLSFCRWCA